MHLIHSPTRKIQIYFHGCMANSKRKFKLLCPKLSSSLKYIEVRQLHACLFVFMVLICNSFGTRLEWPCMLQILIKMIIRLCLMWEGLVLLYWNFMFKHSLASWIKPGSTQASVISSLYISTVIVDLGNRNNWDSPITTVVVHCGATIIPDWS